MKDRLLGRAKTPARSGQACSSDASDSSLPPQRSRHALIPKRLSNTHIGRGGEGKKSLFFLERSIFDYTLFVPSLDVQQQHRASFYPSLSVSPWLANRLFLFQLGAFEKSEGERLNCGDLVFFHTPASYYNIHHSVYALATHPAQSWVCLHSPHTYVSPNLSKQTKQAREKSEGLNV